MGASNREIQLRKTCQLYVYVLNAQKIEVEYSIQECADSYDYPVDCVEELYNTLKNLESETFKKIVYDNESDEARDLANWWEMYKLYTPVPK